MASATYLQTSFLGGERSPLAQGRIDQPDYRTGMNVCLNGLPIEAGAWVRRPGTQIAAPTRGGVAGRVIPFNFRSASPYTMELTDGYLRFFNGPTLAKTNDGQTIVSISTANPAKVATGTHGWASGEQAMFSNLGTACPLLHNRAVIMTVTSSTEFTIADAITGASINGATLGVGSLPVDAQVSRIHEITTPWVSGAWSSLRSVQALTSKGDVNAVMLHGNFRPQALSITSLPTSASFAQFALNPINFTDGPYFDPVPGGALITPSGTVGVITLTLAFPAFNALAAYSVGDYVTSGGISYISLQDANVNHTPVSSPTFWAVASAGAAVGPSGFTASDVGRHIRLYSEPLLWDSGSNYSAGDKVAFNNSYWTALTSITAGSVNAQPGISASAWAVNARGSLWSWGRITAVTANISQALGTIFGNMVFNGGNAASFTGNISKLSGVCSAALQGQGGGVTHPYVGKNLTSSPQRIQTATIYPSTNEGFIAFNAFANRNITINLRASHTPPAVGTDGTVLGSSGLINGDTLTSVSIGSNDTATSWEYVWIEIAPSDPSNAFEVLISQIFFTAASAVSSGTQVSLQLLGAPLLYTTPVRTWRLGLFSDTTGWPKCGTYSDGRLWLTGAVGNRFDGSVSNDPYNFAPTGSTGAVADNNAISYTFNAQDVNEIFWITPEQNGIVLGTQAGEWLVQATTLNAPLTPTSIHANRVTKNGCANIEPRRGEHTLLFVQKFQRKVLEGFADVYSGKFSTPNLSEKAKHLTVDGVEEIAYQQELAPILWARTGAGGLIGVTYKRDSLTTSQGPTFAGWHRHTLGSGRSVESICVGQSRDGVLDSLSMVTNDSVSNIRHVEVMTDIFDESRTLADGWFVDSGITPSATQNVTVSGVTYFQLLGLWPLNGKTVSVFAGGLDLGEWPVTNGACNVPFNTSNAEFTQAFVSGYVGTMPVVAGFTYTSDGQIVRPATPVESGSRLGPSIGMKRRTADVQAILYKTRGLSFGTSFSRLRPATLRSEGETTIGMTEVFTGVLGNQNIDDASSYDSMICWRITRPFPATITAIGGSLSTQG